MCKIRLKSLASFASRITDRADLPPREASRARAAHRKRSHRIYLIIFHTYMNDPPGRAARRNRKTSLSSSRTCAKPTAPIQKPNRDYFINYNDTKVSTTIMITDTITISVWSAPGIRVLFTEDLIKQVWWTIYAGYLVSRCWSADHTWKIHALDVYSLQFLKK